MDIKVQLLLLALVLCGVAVLVRFSAKSALHMIFNADSHSSSSLVEVMRTSLALLLMFVASAVVINIGLQRMFGYGNELTTIYFATYLHAIAGADSWGVMVKALTHLDAFPSESIYDALILKDQTKFQYPPSALLIFDLPHRFFGLSYEAIVGIANIISWLCLPLLGIVFYKLIDKSVVTAWHTTSRLFSETQQQIPVWMRVLALLTGIATVAMFYPILRSYFLGQVQTFMTLLAGLALLAWQTKRLGAAGVLLSICCSFKPQWIILIPWAFIRRQWHFLITFSISSAIIFLVSVSLYGVENWTDYFSVLSFLSQHGESFYPNQSINGIMHRLLLNGNNLEWLSNTFPPYHPWVYLTTLLTSALLLAVALFWKFLRQPNATDLSIMMLSLTIASPIAWEHHYGIAILLLAIILPLSVVYRPLGQWTVSYIWVMYLLISQNFGYFASSLADTYWNVLQSTLYIGVIMLLWLLYKLSQKQHKPRIANAGR
ncbi:glycosyltransferase family 87 protein [Methylotenera sp. 1P/1]|uniref:glycosyltransferase family 87 protein n=1 Tax=Methylotenera sp. 1P/1 TaxID=1131551 RepID=UPI000362235B|nr:glycosyltransferase family 87 protein [Methylotenera sp. 1P/1]